MKRLILICFVLAQVPNVFAQDSLQNTKQSEQQVEEAQLSQEDYYRLLLEKTEKQNQDLLSTLHWSIASIITILIAIIGTSVWYNYRFSNKEVENIISAAERKVEELEKGLKESLDEDFSEYSKETKNNINKEIETNLSSFKEQLRTYNKSYDERFTNLRESINNAIKLNQIVFDKLENHVDFRAKVLEDKIEKNSGKIWNLEGVKSNALSSFIRSAKIKTDLGWDPKYILNDIVDVLKEVDWISKVDKDSLEELLKKLGDSIEQKSTIKELVEELSVHDFTKTSKRSLFANLPNFSDIIDQDPEDENS